MSDVTIFASPPLLLAALGALTASLILTPIVRRFGIRRGYLDIPTGRSSHDRPTPRTGGLAVIGAIIIGLAAAGAADVRVVVLMGGALAAALLALADDRRPLPRFLRLITQFVIVGAVVWGVEQGEGDGSLAHPHGFVTLLGAVIWIVALINTYNFMDGLNGMAGIAATVTGVTLAVIAQRNGDVAVAALAVATAAAMAGFLPFNLPRGSIFLGDAGSTSLGLLFGTLVVLAGPVGSVSLSAGLPLTPFLLDAGTTLVRRALRGERFFSTPHRSHYYQRLQQAGWSHASVAAVYGLLTAACAAVALGFDRLSNAQRAVAMGSILLGHAAVFWQIQRAWLRRGLRAGR